jgi:ATP-dependent Clp protease ATP-binding subunit ClpA
VVTPDGIAHIVSRWTGIPVDKMLEGEREKLLRMEQVMHSRVIGQDEAVTAVSEAVIRARSGLKDPNRPVGSFIFLGPTGVGKTELARALAEFLFDDQADAMAGILRALRTARLEVAHAAETAAWRGSQATLTAGDVIDALRDQGDK